MVVYLCALGLPLVVLLALGSAALTGAWFPKTWIALAAAVLWLATWRLEPFLSRRLASMRGRFYAERRRRKQESGAAEPPTI